MNALDLLRDLKDRGVVLTPRNGKLIVEAPLGALRAGDRDLLSQLKVGLLAMLEANPTPDELSPEWHESWEERAAILQFEGGLCREQAEALALADVKRTMERTPILSSDMLDIATSSSVES